MDAEERELERLVFGGNQSNESEEELEQFFPSKKKGATEREKRKPAWVDQDDEEVQVNVVKNKRLRSLRKNETETVISGVEYAQRLREFHEKLNPSNKWAEVQENKDENEEDNLFQTTEPIVAQRTSHLPQNIISIRRLMDANREDRSKSTIHAVNFHPNEQVLLVGGIDKTLRLFQVDGHRNSKIQSIFFSDLPIRVARFTSYGREIIVTGERKYFYVVDLETSSIRKVHQLIGQENTVLKEFDVAPDGSLIAFQGQDGVITLVSGTSKQSVSALKMRGPVTCLTFGQDSKKLFSSGTDGEVYVWDLRTNRCLAKHRDEGYSGSTSIALDRTNQYLSVGSEAGIVNVYDYESLIPTDSVSGPFKQLSMLEPTKSFDQLTTPIDHLRFSHDGQMMVMASQRKKSALRLVHTPTMTVFSNWPTSSTLGYVNALDLSQSSSLLAIGNDKGKVSLFQIQHYAQGAQD